MKGIAWLTFFMLGIGIPSCFAQVVFSEPFDEANGSTTGTDNTGGVVWSAVCATCLSGDYFNIQSNVLECEDTNGPAVWTTGLIDISSCSGNAQISMSISAVGTMEECVAGCGCNCVDWVMVEYAINGGAFMSASSSAGGPCAQGCTGGNYALIGDAVAMPYSFSYCIPATGSTLQLRVTAQTWAAGEKYRIDDVTVQCFNCVLPVEMIDFTARHESNAVKLTWYTLSENKSSHFTIERAGKSGEFGWVDSIKAQGHSQQRIAYQFTDDNPAEGINYYRIKQVDVNGEFSYSPIAAVHVESEQKLNIHQQGGQLIISGCMENETISITNVMGHVLYTVVALGYLTTVNHHFSPGVYYLVARQGEKSRYASFFVY